MSKMPILQSMGEPLSEPVTLQDAKEYLRIDIDKDDMRISKLIIVARKAAEQYMRRTLITRSWRILYYKHLAKRIILPMHPVQLLTNVSLFTTSGKKYELTADSYDFAPGSNIIYFYATPISSRASISYIAGYGDKPEDIPDPVRFGLLRHIEQIYDGRAGQSYLPENVMALYKPYRVLSI